MTKILTENAAAIAFAKAWNALNPDKFIKLLAPDACYASQWVFEELVGAPAIAEYLNNKMKTLRSDAANQSSSVRVEIGRTRSDGRDCALMTQGGTNDVKAVVLFEIRDGCIQRYDLCIPQIVVAERTGLYPV